MDKVRDKGIISRMKGLPGLRFLFSRETEAIESIRANGMLELSMALSGLSQHIGLLDEDGDKGKLLRRLPSDRVAQYIEYDLMEEYPICGRALSIHVGNALNRDEETGDPLRIEGRFSDKNPVVTDLRNVFGDWQRENAEKILLNAAKYGCWGIRPYFLPGYRGLDMSRTAVGSEGGQILMKGGQILMKGGQILMKGGQNLIKGGQILMKGGQILMKGGQILMKLVECFFRFV